MSEARKAADWIGQHAARANVTPSMGRTAIGINALSSATTAVGVVAVGVNSQYSNTTGDYNTSLGTYSLQTGTTAYENVAVGYNAMFSATTAYRNTGVGMSVFSALTSGYSNCSVGYNSQISTTTGYQNVSVGSNSMYANTTGYANIGIGNGALYDNTTAYTNCAVGSSALRHNASGNANAALGDNALRYKQDGTNNTSYSNCSGLGSGSRVSGSNQVQLGDSATTTYAYGAVQDRSDARDKADITESDLGLDFILRLKPRKYRVDYREDYFEEELRDKDGGDKDGGGVVARKPLPKDGSKKRNRFHYGLVAQEVKDSMDALGVDFAGYQDHSVNGGCDVKSLGYTEFIAPLIKAVQELAARVVDLEAK